MANVLDRLLSECPAHADVIVKLEILYDHYQEGFKEVVRWCRDENHKVKTETLDWLVTSGIWVNNQVHPMVKELVNLKPEVFQQLIQRT